MLSVIPFSVDLFPKRRAGIDYSGRLLNHHPPFPLLWLTLIAKSRKVPDVRGTGFGTVIYEIDNVVL